MKVLLVNPHIPGNYHIAAPLGLGYIGASLRKSGHEVLMLDLALRNESLRKALEKFKPDYVGLTGMTTQYPDMKRLAGISKDFGTRVVVGGIHVSADPGFVLQDCPSIDFAIKGEGEIAFPSLLAGFIGPGVYFRRNGNIVGDLPKPISSLDELESPWSFLNPSEYFTSKVHGLSVRKGPTVSVISSRGCPYSCSFCSASQAHGKKIRLRSPSNFLEELEFLVRKFGVREVQILDDNFTFYPDHVEEIARGILDRDLKLAWTLPNGIRADRVDRDLLLLMRRAGCYYFGIGIESGSERILKSISKVLSLESVASTSKLGRDLGYITQGFFMIGFPGETREDLRMTLKLALSLPLDRISVNPVIPLPGSQIYHEYVSKGFFDPKTVDWTKFNRLEFAPTSSVGSKELSHFIREINVRFYLNPKRLLRLLLKVRSLSELKGLFVGFTVFKQAVIGGIGNGRKDH